MTSSHVAAARPVPSVLAWASVFGLFSYALLTLRAYLLYADDYNLVSPVRFLSIATGAVLLAMVLHYRRRMGARVDASVIWTIVPAALIVLAVRAIFHRLTDPGVSIGVDLNWILAWTGYFGLWLAAFLVIERSVRLPTFAPAVPRPRRGDDWLIDLVADAYARLPEAERAALRARVEAARGHEARERPVYESADPLAAEVAVAPVESGAAERLIARLDGGRRAAA